MSNRIIAVLVTYHPDLDHIRKVVLNLSNQGVELCIVDNSPYDIGKVDEHIQVFKLGENKGIAFAQNLGMKWAFEEKDAKFVLQMDQDSIPDENLVVNLLEGYEFLVDRKYEVGLIGAQDIDKDSLVASQAKINKGKVLEGMDNLIHVNEVLSSGSLIPKHTYEKVGKLDDKLFIDLVDFEYCWRIASNDLLVVKNTKAVIYHKLGEGSVKILGLISVGLPRPFRHYYSVRNSVYLILYGQAPIFWKVSNTFKILFKLLVYPIALPQGRERSQFIWRGFRDGVNRRFRIINA